MGTQNKKTKMIGQIQGIRFEGKPLGKYRLHETIKVKTELLRTKLKIRSKDKNKVEKQKCC